MFHWRYFIWTTSQGMLSCNLFLVKALMKLHREVPVERLISTKSLLKIHVAYNTRYQIFICTLCHSHVPLKQLQVHLKYGVQHVYLDAPGYFPPTGLPHIWKKEVIHRVSLPVPTSKLGMFICVEMKKHGIIIQGLDKARKIPPHPSQNSPVLGVTIFSHGYTCYSCQYSCPRLDGIQKHCSCVGPERNWVSTPLQTIGRSNFQMYFPLPGYQLSSPPIAQDSTIDTSDDPISDVAALMHQHKENLVSPLSQLENRLQNDFRNVSPCLINLSIHDFLEKLHRRETAEFYAIVKQEYTTLHSNFQRLHSLVQVTLDSDSDLCDPKRRNNIGLVISHHITKFSHGYVYLT